MNHILALQKLSYPSPLPAFGDCLPTEALVEETALISSASGICGICSSGLAAPRS